MRSADDELFVPSGGAYHNPSYPEELFRLPSGTAFDLTRGDGVFRYRGFQRIRANANTLILPDPPGTRLDRRKMWAPELGETAFRIPYFQVRVPLGALRIWTPPHVGIQLCDWVCAPSSSTRVHAMAVEVDGEVGLVLGDGRVAKLGHGVRQRYGTPEPGQRTVLLLSDEGARLRIMVPHVTTERSSATVTSMTRGYRVPEPVELELRL